MLIIYNVRFAKQVQKPLLFKWPSTGHSWSQTCHFWPHHPSSWRNTGWCLLQHVIYMFVHQKNGSNETWKVEKNRLTTKLSFWNGIANFTNCTAIKHRCLNTSVFTHGHGLSDVANTKHFYTLCGSVGTVSEKNCLAYHTTTSFKDLADEN